MVAAGIADGRLPLTMRTRTVRVAHWAALLCFALIVSLPMTVVGQGGRVPLGYDGDAEREIHERLARLSPEAVPLFARATEALQHGELDKAKRGFEDVLALAPRFPDASRRLSEVELARDDATAARRLAYQAYGYEPSPLNIAALSEALMAADDPVRVGEAFLLARSAAQALPDDMDVQGLYVRAAVARRDQDAVRTACSRVAEAGLQDGVGHYCRGVVLASKGRWVAGESELLLATELGVPAEDVEWTLGEGIRLRAWLQRRLQASGLAILSYSVFLVVLLAMGVGLGRMTVAVARTYARRGELRLTAPERSLHFAYRAVIVLTSVYFYASLPLFWLALVSAWLAVFLLEQAGQPSWVIAAAVLALITLQYILATIYVGLTARVKQSDPGRGLTGSEAPVLWALVAEVAERLHTRAIEAIYVVPDARISVQEEGRTRDILRGRGTRCLVVGLGLLPGMTQRQFAAVLAHEYAHFANRDTAGGQIARQVHASMQRMAVQLTMVGQNRWYSPGWWYVSAFTRLFLLVTMGASRLHEILADRAAAATCGVRDFVSALRHITRQDLTFSAQVRREMRLAKEQGRPVANLYALPPVASAPDRVELEASIERAMVRPTSRFDTHLSTGERIALLEPLAPGSPTPDDSASAWELFADPGGVQAEMTDVIRATVRRREDRLLRAVAEAHDDEASRLRTVLRRWTWFWRTIDWPGRQGRDGEA